MNNRKTKGVNFEKIEKIIDKAKRNHRLEMLVIDKDTFYYCLKAKKKLPEPYIRAQHGLPRIIDSSERTIHSIDHESDSPSSMTVSESFPLDISTKFTDPARRLPQEMKQQPASSSGISEQNTSSVTQEISTDESLMNFVMNTVNTFFHHTGTDKSIDCS